MVDKNRWNSKVLWKIWIIYNFVKLFFVEDEIDFMKDVFGFMSS